MIGMKTVKASTPVNFLLLREAVVEPNRNGLLYIALHVGS